MENDSWIIPMLNSPEARKALECAPAMIFELPKKSDYVFNDSGSRESGSRDFQASRVKDMVSIYIMYQGIVQCYRAKQLDYCVHYQMPQDRLEVIFKECRRLEDNSAYAPKIIVIAADEDFEDDFLLVRNNPKPEQLSSLDFVALMNFVLENQPKQKKCVPNPRNTPKIDLGTTGYRNSRRDRSKAGLGLPKPFRFAHTETEEGKAILRGASDAFKGVFHDQTNLYFCDEERNATFAEVLAGPGSVSESVTALVAELMMEGRVSADHYLTAHTDIYNDKRDSRYRAVMGFSCLLYNGTLVAVRRPSAVMYGKQSAFEFMDKARKYGPILREMYDTWDQLPEWQKIADQNLIPGPEEPMGRILEAPHSLKTVLYSVFADTIDLVLSTFPELAKEEMFIGGLLFCTTISNCPQHFWFEMRKIAGNRSIGEVPIADMSTSDLIVKLYEHLYYVKDNKVPKAGDYKTTARHQPCHNKLASKIQIMNSVSVIIRVVRDLQGFPRSELEADVPYFCHGCITVITRKCIDDRMVDLESQGQECGVYMAGPLIAQHIVGVAACLGVIPPSMGLHAQIGPSTGTWTYYRDKFDLKMGLQVGHSDTILLAASSYLGIAPVQAEELACLSAKRAKSSGYRTYDFVGPGGHLYIPVLGKKTLIMCINRDGQMSPTSQWIPNPQRKSGRERNPPLWQLRCLQSERANMPVKKTKSRKLQMIRMEHSVPMLPGDGLLIPTPHVVVCACKSRHATRNAREAEYNQDVTMRKCLATYARYDVVFDETPKGDLIVEERYGAMRCPQPQCTKKWSGKRPPKRKCVHHFNYYSHGLRHSDGSVFYPEKDFPLREDYTLNEGVESVEIEGRRWFRSAKASLSFTVLALAAELGYAEPTGLFTDFFTESVHVVRAGDVRLKVVHKCRQHGQDRIQHGEKKESYQRLPYIVGVHYREGGRAFYITDPAGQRVSGVFAMPKPPREYLAVYDHEARNGKIWITIMRPDYTTDCIRLSDVNREDLHWPLYQYARRNSLLDKPGWKRFSNIGDLIPEMTISATSHLPPSQI